MYYVNDSFAFMGDRSCWNWCIHCFCS